MKISLSITLVLLASTWASAQSSVWKATKDGSITYLGGTCHLLRPSDFPLPDEFDEAYNASEVIVFETDIGALKEPAAQQAILSRAVYDDGSTIDQHLSAEAYALLSSYCSSNSIPLEMIKQFKPSMIIIVIMMGELKKLGVSMEGVDAFYYKKATDDGKTLVFLETVEEQVEFIFGMSASNENDYVSHSINEVGEISEVYENLADAWRRGDTEKLGELMVKDLKEAMPQLYKELLTDRNKAWLPKLQALHETPEVELVLVGVGHMVGPDGIIFSLQEQGYQVEKVTVSEKSPEKVVEPAIPD